MERRIHRRIVPPLLMISLLVLLGDVLISVLVLFGDFFSFNFRCTDEDVDCDTK